MVVVHFIIQWVIDDGGEGDVHEEISLGPPAIASSSKTFHIKRLLGWICMYSIEARASLLLRMQSSCNYICTYTITDDVLYCYRESC